MEFEGKVKALFNGYARIDRVSVNIAKGLAEAKITPQDLTNPVAFQLAFSKLYDTLLKVMESGDEPSYVAEVRFKDSLGNEVVMAVDLGKEMPAFTNNVVKARITVELFEE